MNPQLRTEFATSLCEDPRGAVEELRSQLSVYPSSGLLFFCSAKYDLVALGAALHEHFPGVVVGCTSAGQLSPKGFQLSGIAAVGLSSEELTMTPFLIHPLKSCEKHVAEIARKIREENRSTLRRRSFGLLLIDGLSMAEEQLTAMLYQSLGNTPIIGGSAGDDLAFSKTFVYSEGQFISDAALFILFETTLPFRTLKFQHFIPTEKKLVITAADPERRIVYEINGAPAVEAYAELLGCEPGALGSGIFSANPLMLKIHDEYYVRSIQRTNPDGSLTLFCAIEEGLVLTIGKGVDALEIVEAALLKAQEQFMPALIIGCDCILRRLELEKVNSADAIGGVFAAHKVFGFSTYGEQYNSIHVNQTFTGVAIGG